MIHRENPFSSIYQICNSGDANYKMANLPQLPRYIDVELTNYCNFRCLMCPTGNMTQKRKKGFMSDEVYFKILKNIREHRTPVRFIRWGEPTLHPRLLHYISSVKQEGILCHVNTNGSLLTEKYIIDLIATGLDSIKFSFQGADAESYAAMRNADNYNQLIETMKLFRAIRGDREKPFIHASTTITYENGEMVRQFKDTIGQLADFVNVGRTVLERIDIKEAKLGEKEIAAIIRLKEQESVVKKHLNCIEVFDKVSINWDGTVSACCGDYDNMMIVGDITLQPLTDIWKSKKMNGYRKLLANMQHGRLKLCRHCYDYHGLQTPGLQQLD